MTDLAPEQTEGLWYAMRGWIEQGFKLLKSGGWQWQATRMTDPERAERLWLVLAVSLLVAGGLAVWVIRQITGTVATVGRTVTAMSTGIVNENLVPRPTADSTCSVPLMSSTRARETVRPRPVPPKCRVVDVSAWENG